MRMRIPALGLRFVILAAFAVFFIAPVLWLILAPTKGDNALVTSDPFAFGSFDQVSLAWQHLDAFSDQIYRRWIVNTLYYTLTATAITLVVSVPAGYGLALGNFPGRKLILSLTLITMIMPAAALVLPIFLELNAMHLIGRVGIGDPAVRVLPVRRLPRVHLLRHGAPARPARRRTRGRLR